jgi:ribosomal protein S18 acetylase RimI-like enzyme
MKLTNIKIRSIANKDTQERHEFFLNLAKAKEGMINTPEEIGFNSYDTQEQINYFLSIKNSLWLIAEYKNKIIAEIDITRYQAKKLNHVGKLTIGVLPQFQSLGLGSLLMQKALDWASINNFNRLELFVFKSNIKAQNLYKKFGFVIEGERKNFIKLDNNNYENDLLMAKYL